ncbi:NAD-dependent epimerase/dehydratase family protein, partial [Thioalkalivibrio sp.]
MHVAVTGAAGCVGQAALPVLAREPAIQRIIALDRAAPALPPPGEGATIEARVLDLAKLQPEDLAGTDTLVHLAFQLMGGHGGRRRHDRAWIREQNVALSNHVFR